MSLRFFFPLALLSAFTANAQFSCKLIPQDKQVPLDQNALIGDLIAECSGDIPGATAGQPAFLDFTLALGANIANPTSVPNSAFTTAVLFVDDPAPAAQIFAPVKAASGFSFQGTPADANAFFGVRTNANGLSWKHIPVRPSANGTRRFRLTNVRAVTERFAESVSTETGSPDLPYQVDIAPPASAGTQQLKSSVKLQPRPLRRSRRKLNDSRRHNRSENAPFSGTSPKTVSGKVAFDQPFPNFFRATTPQDTLGATYNTNAGFTSEKAALLASGFNPQVPGTLVRFTWSGIPPGVDVWTFAEPPNPGGVFQATSPGTNLAGFIKPPVTSGTASVTWELVSPGGTAPSAFEFPYYISFVSGGTLDTAPLAPSHITLETTIIPGAPVTFPDPNPQFPAPIGFSINSATGAPPSLTSTSDLRSCYVGVFLNAPWNACAPDSGLIINLNSTSGPITPLGVPTFPADINATLVNLTSNISGTGVTPVQTQVNIDASKAKPGVYPGTIGFTAEESSTSLTVPLTVNVLPPNNPVVLPSGLVDAFSYQTGPIAPGQIFALFGRNFGPATGLVNGTLDAGGKLSTSVSNTTVTFDNIPAPLLYVANGQLAGVTPFSLKGKTSTTVRINSNELQAPPFIVPVAASSISISSANASGGGQGTVLNADLSLNSATNPTSVGKTVVIYVSYAGPTNTAGTDGRTTLAPPYPAPTGPLSVTFGGIPATDISYFGNVPSLLESVMQINVTVPAAVQPDLNVPVIVSAGGATSTAWTTIAIR